MVVGGSSPPELNGPVFKTSALSRLVIHQIFYIMSANYKIINYFQELKYRSFYIFFAFLSVFSVIYFFSVEFLYYIIKPLGDTSHNQINSLIYTDLSEAFFSTILLIMYFSLYLNSPFIIYQIYYFIIPGTYKYEQHFLLQLIFLSLSCLFISCLISYFIFIPFLWNFFLNYGLNLNSELLNLNFQGKINEYINFIIRIFSNLAFCFQVPIILFVFLKTQILSANLLKNSRSCNIIFCFILGALFSPPDVFSQMYLAIPLCLVYEISIIFGLFLNRKCLHK